MPKSLQTIHKKRKAMFISICIIFAVIIGVLLYFTKRSYIDPVVMEVHIESEKVNEPIKYLFFADLHENIFGKGNQQLYDLIRDLEPDFILIGGDLINWTSADGRPYAKDVIMKLNEIANVYVSLGNHEIEYLINRKEIDYSNKDRNHASFKLLDKDDNGLIATIRNAGGVVLQKTWTEIEVRGTMIRIGAAYEDMYSLNKDHPGTTMQTGMYSFLTDFQDTDALTLYMAHRPSSFLLGNGTSLWDIDVVMSGHEHGGQAILPFLGGVFSRERGLFPEYTHGTFVFANTTMIVTSGLGSSDEGLPRFNNPPEVVLVTVR